MAADLTTGLVFKLDFAEESGSIAADSSGNGHGFTLAGTGDFATAGKITIGPAGRRCLKLNGTNNCLYSTSAIDLSGTNVLGISLLYRHNGTLGSGGKMLMEFSPDVGGVNDGFAIWLTTFDGKMQVQVLGNTSWSAFKFAAPTDDTWYRLTFNIDKSKASGEARDVYYNATLQTIDTTVFDFNNTGNFGNRTLYIGARNNTSFWSPIEIGDFFLFNRALTSDDRDKLVARSTESNADVWLNRRFQQLNLPSV